MTATTTADRVDDDNLVDAAARAQADAAGKTLATIEPEQTRFTEHQVAILRQIGLEDATQGDLDLFFHVCRTTGLDPFRKQIYMIGRNTKLTEWVEDERAQNGRRKVERWVTKYTIQTGIDGYRRNVREAAKAYGDSLAFDGPFFCGEDGEWREVWPAKTPPLAAKFVVIRNGERFTGIAHFDEFVQTNAVYEGSGQSRRKVGDEPNSMWTKMPRGQIAKCAEALAYRRAYPDDFAGLILEDSAQSTVIDQDGNVERQGDEAPPRRRGGGGVAGMRRAREERAAQRRGDVIEGEVIGDEAAEQNPADPVQDAGEAGQAAPKPDQPGDLRKAAREKLFEQITDLFAEAQLDGDERRGDRLVVIRAILGKPEIESTKELDEDDLQDLRNGLHDRKQDGSLDAAITDWLNADQLRREGQQ